MTAAAAGCDSGRSAGSVSAVALYTHLRYEKMFSSLAIISASFIFSIAMLKRNKI